MKKYIYSLSMVILFLTLTSFIFLKIEYILTYKDSTDQPYSYYNDKSQLDIVFIGTSQLFNSIIPVQLWNDFGITSYNRAKDAQFYKVSYYLIKEAIEEKKPKIIVMDVLYLLHLQDLANGSKQINRLKFSLNRYQGFKDIYPNENIVNLFSYNYYHSRWKLLQYYDFNTTLENVFFGYAVLPRIFNINSKPELSNKNNTPEKILKNDTILYAKKIVELCKKNNTEIIFVRIPQVQDKLLESRNQLFEDFCKKNNYVYIDFNKNLNMVGIDFNTDFYDAYHLNRYGAIKITSYIGKYLVDNYNLIDKRNNRKYEKWNLKSNEYKRFINKEELYRIKSFTHWKKQAFYDNYTVMISINGDVLSKLPDTLKNDLKSFGLNKYNTDKANMRYAAIIDDNKVFFEEISNKPVTYKGRMKNIVNLLISSDGKATINVSGKPRSKNKYGLNFVIYDKVNREIVDSIWIDPSKPDEVRR